MTTKMTAGATPSSRLNMKEFLKQKLDLIEEAHTKLILKRISLVKELEDLDNQYSKLDGFKSYYKQFLKEWLVYESDTMKLRVAEQAARADQDARSQKLKENAKKRKPRKRDA